MTYRVSLADDLLHSAPLAWGDGVVHVDVAKKDDIDIKRLKAKENVFKTQARLRTSRPDQLAKSFIKYRAA